VVDEGMLVKKGERLVELDSSTLSENVLKQRIAVIASKAKLERSKSDLITAELNLQEYEEGTFIQNLKTIENEIFTAQESVHTQEDNLAHYQRLLAKNYITDSKVEADLVELKKAENALEIAELKKRVFEEISYKKMVNLYKAVVASNKATVKANEETLRLDTARLEHLEEQQRRCTINAPRDGQVVYYMPRWGGDEDLIRVSKKVFERQILLQLPDPTQMQVKGLVNEANIRLVKPGQKATIRLEAFPNQVFEGVVKTVNDYPEPGNFMGGSMSKEYMTIITILNAPEGIKTGLTAEARITVNEIPDALLLPMQSVYEYGGIMYVFTYNDGKWGKIEVKTGPANDKDVVILEGIKEGDEVVLGAGAHRDKIDLPKLEVKADEKDEEMDEEMFREQMRREGQPPQGGGQPSQPREQRPAGSGGNGAAPGGNVTPSAPPGGVRAPAPNGSR
jgi:multidrug efflux pump subunit AcrA (membrane-fusion protein)